MRKRDALKLVESDVKKGIGKIFVMAPDGFEHPEPFGPHPIGQARFAAVVWRFTGRHAQKFAGLAPTQTVVTINGVTVVDLEADDPIFHRFVDWNDVARQLGLASVGRSVQPREPDRVRDAKPAKRGSPRRTR